MMLPDPFRGMGGRGCWGPNSRATPPRIGPEIKTELGPRWHGRNSSDVPTSRRRLIVFVRSPSTEWCAEIVWQIHRRVRPYKRCSSARHSKYTAPLLLKNDFLNWILCCFLHISTWTKNNRSYGWNNPFLTKSFHNPHVSWNFNHDVVISLITHLTQLRHFLLFDQLQIFRVTLILFVTNYTQLSVIGSKFLPHLVGSFKNTNRGQFTVRFNVDSTTVNLSFVTNRFFWHFKGIITLLCKNFFQS